MSAAERFPNNGGQRGVSRVLVKLDNSIEQGDYYEAHQMYRTLYFRYVNQEKYNECLDLLFGGAMKLLSKNQETSASDLSLLIIDTLEKRGMKDNKDVALWIDRLCDIIKALSSTTVERETLIQRAIKWSADVSGISLGHPTLHKLIAQVHTAEDNTELARHHFLLCQDGNLCGHVLIKISEKKGYGSEVDLFIVQAVLQQLCLKDRKTAEETFTTYTENHPHLMKKEKPYKQPLLNYVYFLFRIIDLGNLMAFRVLCKLYEPSLERDPSFIKYLGKIGVIFFGAEPPPPAGSSGMMGGMFGDLFTRLFQGFDEEEEDDELRTQSALPNELD